MNKIDAEIVKKTALYATDLLEHKLPVYLAYHQKDHTLHVVERAETIGKAEGLSDEEMNILKVCAWFHDVGYIRKIIGHEEESILIATEFLNKHKVDQKEIDRVTEILRSTKIPQTPETNVAKVLCDADLMHLGHAG